MPTGTLAGANGRVTGGVPVQPRRTLAVQRRRQLPWLIIGIVLVLGCALAFATIQLRAAGNRAVLVATRALPIGHALSTDDVRVVRVRLQAGVSSLPAAAEPGLLGRPLTAAVATGQLLPATAVGEGGGVPAGQAVVALALKPGQYPPALAAGAPVEIVDAGTSGGGTAGSGDAIAGASSGVRAVVTSVDAATAAADGTTVVTVQVADGDAAAAARLGAAGRAALILLPTGGSR